MSSPVAVVGLVWDGHDLQRSDLEVFMEITEGLDDLPETRGEDQLIPFRAGRLPGLRLPHRRPIVAVGHVMGPADATARPAFRAYVDDLHSWMDPTAGEKVLVATLEDGSTRWITCAARNILPGEGWASEYRAFSLEWEAVSDPLWHASNGLVAMDSGLVLDDELLLDSDAAILIVPASGDHFATFWTIGTAEIPDGVIEIDGPSTGVVSFGANWTATGSGFSYPQLAAGETLIVDTGNRTVTIGTVNARGSLVLYPANRHGEYFRLLPGANSLHVTGHPAAIRIRFSAAFL